MLRPTDVRLPLRRSPILLMKCLSTPSERVSELNSRQVRLARELLWDCGLRWRPSGQFNKYHAIHEKNKNSSVDLPTGWSEFPGCCAFLVQNEEIMRTSDVPCFGGFRSSTMFEYITGVGRVPQGMAPWSRKDGRSEGHLTAALVSVQLRASSPHAPAQWHIGVDVFLPTPRPCDRIWHAPVGGLQLGSSVDNNKTVETPVGLWMASDATLATTRWDNNSCSTILKRYWDIIASHVRQNTSGVHPLPVVLPYGFLFLPRERRVSEEYHIKMMPLLELAASKHECDLAFGERDRQFVESLRMYHPLSAVLQGMLMFQASVRSSTATSSAKATPWSYTLPQSVAAAWGLPGTSHAYLQHLNHSAPFRLNEKCDTVSNVELDTRRLCVLTAYSGAFDKIRCFKSPRDVRELLRCAAITSSFFRTAVEASLHAVNEQQVVASMQAAPWSHSPMQADDVVTSNLSPSVFAYPPVVAAGRNALTVHHVNCLGRIRDDDWMLVDAGAEWQNIYSTDCTRCWPTRHALKRFLAAMREPQLGTGRDARLSLYNALLVCQRSILQFLVKDVCIPRQELLRVAREHISNVLDQFTPVGSKSALTSGVFELLSAHSVGHFTGFDIHERGPPPEACRYAAETIGSGARIVPLLLPGTVHTVEPGLYVRDATDAVVVAMLSPSDRTLYQELVPDSLCGVGMRIEDSVLFLPRQGDRSYSGHTRDEYLEACLDGTSLSCAAFIAQQTQSIFGGSLTELPTTDHWYPFHIVVLTACIPKDMEQLCAHLLSD